MDENMKSSSGTIDDYETMGHEAYFAKFNRLQGMTKQQLEVTKRQWNKDTFRELYKLGKNGVDDFK